MKNLYATRLPLHIHNKSVVKLANTLNCKYSIIIYVFIYRYLRYILQNTILNLVAYRHDRQLQSLAFLQLQCDFYIGGTLWRHACDAHSISTRLNGSYQYYYHHQYCKLITRLQANSTDTLLEHFWVSNSSLTSDRERKVKNKKSNCKHFNIDIFMCIYIWNVTK